MKKNIILITIILLAASSIYWLIQLIDKHQLSSSQKPTHQLIVSVLPQQQIVSRIAGDDFAVNALIPPGFSPATYDPTTEEMQTVSQAEIYFTIGHIPFEATHLNALTEINPTMQVVNTSVNNTFREIEDHSHDEQDVSNNSEQTENIDPHVWLSPKMVKKQSAVIYDTLVATYPNQAEEFATNYEELNQDLDQLDQDLQLAFAPIQGKTMLVYHPAFGYLARDYNFTQEHIEIEGKEPSVQDIQNIIDEAQKDDARVIFVQKQFSQDSATAIADSIGGVVVEVDPLDPDYFTNMKTMAQKISNSL